MSFSTGGLVLLIASVCQGQQPSSGVALYSEKLDSYLSNNSLIISSDIGGLGNGIACYTAADESPSGAVWNTPDGENIRTSGTSGATSLVFFTQTRPQRVVLLRGGVEFSVVNEGVYTCHISDENGETQTLFIGIYTTDNAGGPLVHSPVFSLLTELTTHPSQFTITCPSSSTPPAFIVWTRDGHNIGLNHFESSQVLLNALSSHYDNVLSVKGDLVGVYMCEVGNVGGRNSASLTVRVPSSPPMEVRAVSGGSNSVHVSWTPPTSGANGYLILYRPTSQVYNETVRIDDSTATSYIIENVMEQIEYTIQMLAYLELSTSLSNTVEIKLDESLFQLHLSGFLSTCNEFVYTVDRTEKLKDITSAVLEELTDLCIRCGITDDIIDRQLFKCYPESPTYVTYRARLEGTSETDSGSLISLIEEWVRGGANISVTGVLLTVDTDCPVAILSLNKEECKPPTPTASNTNDSTASSSNNITTIIGGAVAISVIIAIVIVIIAIVTLKLKRRGDSRKAEEHSMASLDSRAVKGVAITTTPNSAYGKIQKRGTEKDYYEVIGSPSHISNYPLLAVQSPVASGGVEVAEDQVVYEPIPGEK